jgi:Na+/proline symporter
MSDISFQFTWLDLLLFALLIGSPGLLLGVVLGAVAWRRHRIYGAALGATLGLGVWIGLRFLWR